MKLAFETSLQPDYETSRMNIRTLDNQISNMENKVSKASETLAELDKRLLELKKIEEDLSSSLRSVNDRRREFELELDRIDIQRRKLEQVLEPLNNETHRLDIQVQTRKTEVNHLREEIQSLGYNNMMETAIEDAIEAENTIKIIRPELENLGSVNQLAITQYGEQQEKYKQLSIRRNQLEIEKKTILDFMDEIEQKKLNAFMQAFNSINQSFAKFFMKLTGNGASYLKLQNAEDPFTGGIDIFVQFPGKGMRLIAGASGGEKSVTAVAFVLLYRAFHHRHSTYSTK